VGRYLERERGVEEGRRERKRERERGREKENVHARVCYKKRMMCVHTGEPEGDMCWQYGMV